jgi:hypothetical protein
VHIAHPDACVDLCRGTATGAVARLRNRQLFLALQHLKLYAADRQQKRQLQQVAADWHLDCCQKRSLTAWRQSVQVGLQSIYS